MAQCHGFTNDDITIAVVVEIVKIRTTDTGTLNCDLNLFCFWWWESTSFLAKLSMSGEKVTQTGYFRRLCLLTIFRSLTPCKTDALTFEVELPATPLVAVIVAMMRRVLKKY
jgi:hypothetical protein